MNAAVFRSSHLSRFGLTALALCLLIGVRAGAEGSAPSGGSAPSLTVREIRAMRYPSLSPDGSRIAFSYRGDIWTVSSAGGEAKRVAALPGWDSRPRWSPDGSTLAFDSDVNGNADIFTMPAGGLAVGAQPH